MPQHRSSATAVHRVRADPAGERALRADILDALGGVVAAADDQGRVMYWNAAAEAVFGWSAEEAIGSDLVTLLPAEGSRGDAVTIIRDLRAGNPWSGEIFLRDRNGRSFPMHVTATPLRDRDGGVVGMVGMGWDMSAQHTTEQALRESEQRLELVHRAAVSVIWEWDVRTHRMRWNDAVADTFGYPRDEVEETVTWWEERVHPADRDRVTSGLWETLSEGRRFWTDEYRFRTGDGSYATIFDRAYVATDESGRPERVVGTMVDLTERRRSHEAARALSQAGMLLDLSLDYETALPGIARLAASGMADACVLVLGGPNALEMVATHAATPPRRRVLERFASHLRVNSLGGGVLHAILRGGEATLLPSIPESLYRSMDPALARIVEDLDVASAALAPISARGETVGGIVLARGFEGPPMNEDDLRIAEELGRRIGMAVDNARLFQTAELAKRAKSDFLSVVSHELRTPLTAVLGYADLLEAEISGTLNETQKQQVGRIRAGSDRLLRVIEGILAYTRLEAGQEQLQLERRPLRAIMEYIGDMIRPQARENGIEYVEAFDAAPLTVKVDVVKLNHVLLSLLTNAVKFSEHGTVRIAASVEGEDLLFQVTDSGPGIAPEHLPHIFNPFWQAEQPEVRRASGAGLGLSVARRLARLMGGDLSVTGTTDRGTTFQLRLPGACGE